MTELIGAGKIAFYTAKPRKEIYGCFPNWADHQRVRESKQKVPAPDDTSINDWYLKRFIPKDLKKRIIERDKMKCQECGKYIFSDISSSDRAIKFGAGLFHIDHIVPVAQGGRATEENLRLLCPRCNLTRKRHFTVDEILNFSQVAESCGELPQVAESRGLNPIQSESNPNPNTNRRFTPPTRDEVAAYITEKGYAVDADAWMAHYESNGWRVGSNPMKDWKAAVRTWVRNDINRPRTAPARQVIAQQYTQREHLEDVSDMADIFADEIKEGSA